MDQPESTKGEESFLLVSNRTADRSVTMMLASGSGGDPSPEKNSRLLFGVNLFLFIFLGVLFCGWILRYTDWFPIVGGILTLTGALSWLAFVIKILPEEPLKDVQALVFGGFFSQPWACWTLATLIALLGLLASCFGSIQLEPLQQTVDRRLWIEAARIDGTYRWSTNREAEFERLPANGEVRSLRWTGWTRKRFMVKVEGYPGREVTVGPLQREDLFCPSSFRCPVLLLLPTKDLTGAIDKNPKKLRIELLRQKTNILTLEQPFDGHAVWIGCEEDVPVPTTLVEHHPLASHLDLRLPAVSATNTARVLIAKDDIRASLVDTNEPYKLYTQATYPILPVSFQADFQPQLELLDAPK